MTGREGRAPFRAQVAEARLERGLTQAQLADLVGVCREQVSRLESGASRGSLRLVAALARELDLDLNQLKEEVDTNRGRFEFDPAQFAGARWRQEPDFAEELRERDEVKDAAYRVLVSHADKVGRALVRIALNPKEDGSPAEHSSAAQVMACKAYYELLGHSKEKPLQPPVQVETELENEEQVLEVLHGYARGAARAGPREQVRAARTGPLSLLEPPEQQ
jgi:transcriptional regulator with XRE-family HTH domain